MKSLLESLNDSLLRQGATINESLSDPVLIRLWDQIRNTNCSDKPTLKDLLPPNTAIDKITPAYRQTYGCRDRKALKAVLSVLNQRKDGVFVLFESGDRFTCMYSKPYINCIKWFFKEDRIVERQLSGSKKDLTEVLQMTLENNDEVHVYDITDSKEVSSWQKRMDRLG